LMFHHFKEFSDAGAPSSTALVKATELQHHQDAQTGMNFLDSIQIRGYRWDSTLGRYISAAMPPVTFAYTEFRPQRQRYRSIAVQGNQLPSRSLNDPEYALVDLFGRGMPDILHGSSTGFRYWRNRGDGDFDPPQMMAQVPAGVSLGQPGVAFADLKGDARADLLDLSGPLKGFYETAPGATWQRFRTITSPNVSISDPNVRLLDLTGDGLTDILVTEPTHLVWYRCLGEEGYGPAQHIERLHALEEFPDIYFSDPRVRLADMNGDGLLDIVLLHNGRVDYWPNLGYGRFGLRITMQNAPEIAFNLDPARLFLADIDGSGCASLVYVDQNRTRFWFNRSGNGWGSEQAISGTPAANNGAAVHFADLFGTGTATLVWSYDFGTQPDGNYKLLDLCGGVKPYLLVEMDNHLGATTRVRYASSTRFLTDDERAGRTWATPLPSPIQVVEKVEVIDRVSHTKLVTSYRYHHGYYDGQDREFRGFGRVDQVDSELFETFAAPGLHPAEAEFQNKNHEFHAPPVETRTWFHTGTYFDPNQSLSAEELTGRYRDEYYQLDLLAFSLPAHRVDFENDPPNEAFRALSGAVLRSEVYALDGT
ncbi:MAG: sugar-binding protein, partial [Acidobacteria bacterium]